MGFLGFGKKKDFVDLGERYRKQKEQAEEMAADSSETQQKSSTQGAFDFLGGLASGSKQESSQPEEAIDVSAGADRKKRLAKRLMEMTSKQEDLANQIYHLQQRIELLERKLEVNRF